MEIVGDPNLALELGDLATVVGASGAAFIVTSFLKKFFNLTVAGTRWSAMLSGLVILVTVTVLSQETTTALEVILSILAGMQAGLAASALFDNVTEGISHVAVSEDAATDHTQ